ncbi:MAG: hypothetical protein BWK76_16230 [Desulfobulbaceae bacterium A2]|jgi:hypothetical protein|nr:MAG: hypothetical protein BWK76_16230 [Desulfobulbaceae bacterium A2]
MAPRLGAQYPLEFASMSKSREEYRTDEYFALDLPVAPAIMVADEIVTEGADVEEEKLVEVIRRHLGM